MPESPPLTDEQLLERFVDNLYITATLQGRFAYLLMSIHAVNPYLMASLTDYNPNHILFSNMVYGTAVHIYGRPHMQLINGLHRLTFSILGSMMFNYSSMLVFDWLSEKLAERVYLLTFCGFLTGRLMMVHLLGYLYHVDTRTIAAGRLGTRDSSPYETMYL